MADPFVAEIRIFAGNFAPRTWALCNGQLMPLSQNTALFALLGTTYGGDGRSTFALPDLQGAAPMHIGGGVEQGPGLSVRRLGDMGGSQTTTLLTSEMPVHSHSISGAARNSNSSLPTNATLARPTGIFTYSSNANPPLVPMDPNSLAISGGDFPHNNMQPYLVLTFIIALQGVFPVRP